MKKLLIAALIAVFGLGSIVVTSGCQEGRRRHKKHKKWKKHKKDKRWKKDKKRKAERVQLKEFFGDKENKYLDLVPLKIGQSRSSARAWLGKKGKKKFKCDEGKFTVKANYDTDDKVKEIKINFDVDKETIVSAAKKKWGEPKKVSEKRIKWIKDELKIIVKRKGGKTKLSIKKRKKKKAGDATKGDMDAKDDMAAKGAMGAMDAMGAMGAMGAKDDD